MLFSPDFLTYFQATASLLDRDPTLWCISTWNDNGLTYFDWDPKKLVCWPGSEPSIAPACSLPATAAALMQNCIVKFTCTCGNA